MNPQEKELYEELRTKINNSKEDFISKLRMIENDNRFRELNSPELKRMINMYYDIVKFLDNIGSNFLKS